MWFKQQTLSKNKFMADDPYLGPPKNLAKNLHAQQTRQEPVFGNQPVADNAPPKPTTIDIDLAPIAPAEPVKPPLTPQFQAKVANQSNHHAHVVHKKPQTIVTDVFTIPADVVIDGQINTQKSITVAGTLKGNILHSAQVLVLPSGSVVGDISAATVEVAGHAQGNITATTLLACRATARIEGDVQYGALKVEEGAIINGTIICLDQSQAE